MEEIYLCTEKEIHWGVKPHPWKKKNPKPFDSILQNAKLFNPTFFIYCVGRSLDMRQNWKCTRGSHPSAVRDWAREGQKEFSLLNLSVITGWGGQRCISTKTILPSDCFLATAVFSITANWCAVALSLWTETKSERDKQEKQQTRKSRNGKTLSQWEGGM